MDYYDKIKIALGWVVMGFDLLDSNNPDRSAHKSEAYFRNALSELKRKSRLIDWALLWAWLTHKFRIMPIPDFAYDKHNERGRSLKRGWGHFFREGTTLQNHDLQTREEEFRARAMKAVDDPGGMSLF